MIFDIWLIDIWFLVRCSAKCGKAEFLKINQKSYLFDFSSLCIFSTSIVSTTLSQSSCLYSSHFHWIFFHGNFHYVFHLHLMMTVLFFIWCCLFLIWFILLGSKDLLRSLSHYTTQLSVVNYGIPEKLVLLNPIIFPCWTIFSFSRSPRKLAVNEHIKTPALKKAIYQTRPQESSYLNHLLLNNWEVWVHPMARHAHSSSCALKLLTIGRHFSVRSLTKVSCMSRPPNWGYAASSAVPLRTEQCTNIFMYVHSQICMWHLYDVFKIGTL